jgi:MFS family permease
MLSVLTAISVSRAPVAAFVGIGLTWGCFAAMVPVLKARTGVDDATFGLMLALSASTLVLTLWAAPRVDRHGGRRALTVGMLFMAAAAAGLGWVDSPAALMLGLILASGTSGLIDVVSNARISGLEAQHGRPLMNAAHGSFSVAYAVSALLTGLLREQGLPPEAIFAVAGGLILLCAPLAAMELAPAPEEDGPAPALPLAMIAVTGAIVAIAFLTEMTVEGWSALHIERTLDGRAAAGAAGPALLGLTMAVGRFAGQAVVERLGELKVIVWATGLTAAGAVAAALAQTPLAAQLGFAAMGLGVSVIGPMGLALAGRLAPASLRTVAIARVAVIGFVGILLGPALMGLIADAAGLRWAYAGVALLLVALWPLSGAARRMG